MPSSLQVKIETKVLKNYFDQAVDNLFNYLYNRHKSCFTKSKKFLFFTIAYGKLPKKQAYDIYCQQTLIQNLECSNSPFLKHLFINYSILFKVTHSSELTVPIEHLKIFLEVAENNLDLGLHEKRC